MTQLANRSNLLNPIRPLHYDFILLDGSGSMANKWWPMLDAIDTYISTLKLQSLSTHINLTVFDTSDLNFTQRNTHIDSWIPCSADPIASNFGGTPLYDAIIAMGLRLRSISPDRPSILIITDGQDQDSKTSPEQARSVINWMKAQGWQVTFMGCDFNNSNQAAALGANNSNSIGVTTALLSDATKAFAHKRAAYGHGAPDINFSDDEKRQFGGYLSAPAAQ